VDFNITGQILIIHSAFVIYLRKNGNKTRQWITYLQTSRKLMIQLGGRSCIISSYKFGVPMKLVRLIKTCLNETFSRIQEGTFV